MGISIYYNVQRSEALSQTEAETLIAIFENCDLDDSLGGEDMSFYDDPISLVGKENGELQGSSKLSPDGPMELLVDLRQKCAALTECRTTVVAATWNVNIDDQDVDWDHDGNVTIEGHVVDWDGDLQGVEEQ